MSLRFSLEVARFSGPNDYSAPMSPADYRHFQAAQDWLELGDWQSANDELENTTPQLRADRDVLKLRFSIDDQDLSPLFLSGHEK